MTFYRDVSTPRAPSGRRERIRDARDLGSARGHASGERVLRGRTGLCDRIDDHQREPGGERGAGRGDVGLEPEPVHVRSIHDPVVHRVVGGSAHGRGELQGRSTLLSQAAAPASSGATSAVWTSATSALTVGSHSLTCEYLGDGNVAPATSVRWPSRDSTATTTVLTRPRTRSARRGSYPHGHGDRSRGDPHRHGHVPDGMTAIGTATLSLGKATLSRKPGQEGVHSITAVYAGSATFAETPRPRSVEGSRGVPHASAAAADRRHRHGALQVGELHVRDQGGREVAVPEGDRGLREPGHRREEPGGGVRRPLQRQARSRR